MFLDFYKFRGRGHLLVSLFLIIGLGYTFLVDTIYLYGFSSDLISSNVVVDTLLIEKTDNNLNIQEVKLSIKANSDGMLYLVFTFKDGHLDAFKLEEEDLEYVDKIMNKKESIFQRMGGFFRGRYAFYMKSEGQANFKTSVEPVLVLDQPSTVLNVSSQSRRLNNDIDEVIDTEGIYKVVDVDYAYQKNQLSYMVFKKSFSEFKPLEVGDLEALISKRMYLDLGNGISEVMVVDIGKQRFYNNETLSKIEQEENPIELDPFVLVVPVDPFGGNSIGLYKNITDEDEFIVYLTHISTLRELLLYKEDRSFRIGYNEYGYYSLNPLQDVGSTEFYIHRYTYVTPVSVLKKVPLKERKKFFRPSLFADDRAYVTALRKYLSLNAYTKNDKEVESFAKEGSLLFTDSVNDRLIVWDSLIPKINDCRKLFGVF